MPQIETTLLIEQRPELVYELACDMESYPLYMENVRSVTVLERALHKTLTAWDTEIDGKSFRWLEQDEFFPEELVIRYRQTKGDLAKFQGQWTFQRAPEGTLVILTVDFDLGIPMLAGLFNLILEKKVRVNCQQMLKGIKDRAESERISKKGLQT